MKKVLSYGLAIVLSGFLIVLLNNHESTQACANFWINPQTGAQECLDNSPSSSGYTNPGSPGGSPSSSRADNSSGTTVSDAINQPYTNIRFNTLPENRLQSRMPLPPSLPQISSSPSNSNGNNSGVMPSSIDQEEGVLPSAFGISNVAFTGSRVLGESANPAQASPYRTTGKLYMAFGGNTYNTVCSASMIGKSLLLTAAHCVHNYGEGTLGWAKKVRFVPAKNGSSEPYRFFESTQFLIPTVYFNGTDTCTTRGVVCNNDIALVALGNNSKGQQAGNLTGYYGYSWGNYSFAQPTSAFQGVFGNKTLAAITQLGYPASHDSGLNMQLNTAYGGYATSGNLKNSWLGSAMTGGSSGGPWLVNFGINAAGADYGSSSNRNIVIGVTSWGYTDGVTHVQGASSFGQNREFPDASYGSRGAGNIGSLVYDACDNSALPNWRLQSKGRCR